MKIHYVLVFCFLSDLLDKDSGFTRTETEGGSITYGCSDTVYGKRKFFCKNRCQGQGDVLIDTNDNTAQMGRYSLKYDAGSVFGLDVTINQLTMSDTGLYRCGYGNPSSPDSYRSIRIIVTEDPSAPKPQTETLRWTSQSFTSSSASFTTTDQPTDPPASTLQTETLRWTSQSFTSSSASFTTTDQPTDTQLRVDMALASGRLSSWTLLGPIIGMLLLAVFLLLLYTWRSRKSSGFTTNMELSGKCEDSVYEKCSINQDQTDSV